MTDLDEVWRTISADRVTEVIRPGWLERSGTGPPVARPFPTTVYLELTSGRHLRLDQVDQECEIAALWADAPVAPAHLDPSDKFVLVPVGDLLGMSAPLAATGMRAMLDAAERMACLELRFSRGRTLLVDPWDFDGLALSNADLGSWRERMHAANLVGLRLWEWSAGTEQVPPHES